MILNLKFLNRQIGFKLISRKNSHKEVIGYTNRCKDGQYILTLDYDDLPFNFVKDEVLRLQQDYMLGDFYIIQSSKSSYHAVCLDKLLYHDFLDILMSTSADYNYIRIPIQSGKKLWVLRITKKKQTPKLVAHLKSDSNEANKSYAHLILLHKILKIPVPKDYEHFDFEKQITFARYKA